MQFIYVICAIFAGVAFAIQPSVNGKVAQSLNYPLQAAFVSFAVGTILLAGINLLLNSKLPSVERLFSIPWWLWLGGGAIGAFVVTAALVIQPQIGAGRWISYYLFGQLVMSMLLDHFGWLGLEVHPIGWMRSLGVFLLVLGTILIANY
ncbi:DMT family transporter [Myxosarcina sp. GI1]|uniref:DMT family transporter n=1 Tax=Myxosarcina sp. GI1 TaxID=1541065 RepID=UPI00056050F1|nr:DMT family transporter [Myxosarcina sp. GI1]